ATQQLSSGNSSALTVAKCSSSGIFIASSGNGLENFIPNKVYRDQQILPETYVPFVHRTSDFSVLTPMETMLYLLHMYSSLPPEETGCSLPPKGTSYLPPEEIGCSLPPEEID
nr:hypothetical protein [Tanacetum cinerariifolium]